MTDSFLSHDEHFVPKAVAIRESSAPSQQSGCSILDLLKYLDAFNRQSLAQPPFLKPPARCPWEANKDLVKGGAEGLLYTAASQSNR